MLLAGTLNATMRGCSRHELQSACRSGVDRASGRPVLVCYTTCHKDGCNGFTSLHRLLELLRWPRQNLSHLSVITFSNTALSYRCKPDYRIRMGKIYI